MSDSWMPRELEAQFAGQYLIPRVLMTSTMKSDPGVPPMRLGAASPGVCVSAAAPRALGDSADGARVFWASSSSAPRDRGGAMALAALAATNPVRNLRRSLRAMTAPSSLWMVGGVYSKLAPYGGTAFGISEHERNMSGTCGRNRTSF